MKITIELPCENEQRIIARFLDSIEEKVNTVGIQIASSRRFKKGLLQQMFV